MSKRSNEVLILDIQTAIERILSYSSELEYEYFTSDFKSQDAIIRNLEIIGEAVKLLSNELIATYPDIPWKDIAGTRDKLIHDYFGVNLDVVWSIIKNDIPLLQKKIADIVF